MTPLKIKICGMLHPENIRETAALKPDYLGFIFHPGSPRYAANVDPADVENCRAQGIRTTGVFVNVSTAEILATADKYGLTTLQLHGGESPEQCRTLRKRGYEVFKVFSVSRSSDLLITTAYEGAADFFLFDTKTPAHGGSGQRFDWNILDNYRGRTPFLLSGGISPLDAEELKTLEHPQLIGIDLNSRFEIEPGLKNTALLERFIREIRS